MRIKNIYIILIFLLLGRGATSAQERGTEIVVDFRVNSAQIDTTYRNNEKQVSTLLTFLRRIQNDPTLTIKEVSFCGAASPEGSHEWNRELAKRRMESLEKLVRGKIEIPDSIIHYDDNYIPWDYLARQIAASNLPRKQLILEILDDEPHLVEYYDDRTIDNRVIRLKRLGRKSWKLLLRDYFIPMRNACMVTVTFKREELPILKAEPDTLVTHVAPLATHPREIPLSAPAVKGWIPRLTLKTNALGWGIGISNAAVEIDLCKHLSFNLPVYYSAWNYFTPTVKFRTLAFQPEIRYWLFEKNHSNDGWFVGAHFGLAWYNIATDGEYRIQDHNGTTPALGGGLAVGYRMPISKNNRWKVELSVGAGAYTLHYDKFRNYKNGLLVGTEKKTYIGIDQASVSFSYTFDLKRKGGAR